MRQLQDCIRYIKSKVEFDPEVAVVLGSGLGYFIEEIDIVGEINYAEIPGFPKSTVEGHKGRFIFGYVGQVKVVVMQGRVHYYEGYTMQEVVLPIRVMHGLGARRLILTNAAGGINKDFQIGDFMLISDHISSFIPSPLIGVNHIELGPRFPDMTDVYNCELRVKVHALCERMQIAIKEGVYIQLSGPNYETPAEIQMYKLLGADAVGMSTVCEAMVANHMGMQVCGISCITNMASGISDKQLNHKEVQETADRVTSIYRKLVVGIINIV